MWISAISSIAALLTAIAALYTILEMKKQRKSSYVPDFAFPTVLIHSYWTHAEKGLPLLWSRSAIRKPEESHFKSKAFQTYSEVEIDCYNVGFGTAKEVKLEWSYHIEKFIKVVLELDVEKIFNIDHQPNKRIDFTSEKLDLKTGAILNGPPLYDHIHILPTSVFDDPTTFRIPLSYIKLYTIYLYLLSESMKKGNPEHGFDKKIPALGLKLNYKNIDNDKFEKDFTIEVDFLGLFSKTDQAGWIEASKVRFSVKENT